MIRLHYVVMCIMKTHLFYHKIHLFFNIGRKRYNQDAIITICKKNLNANEKSAEFDQIDPSE